MLDVHLLGEQLIAGGSDAGDRAPSSRSIALLGYLVLHADAAQSRQQIAGTFWPDSTEAQARTNLRRELHNLRTVLREEPSLRIKPASLAWSDSPSCRVDVRTFRTERRDALSALAEHDDTGFLGHAEEALAAYRGELMPGAYEDWVLDHRERLRVECVELCDLAVDVCRVNGDRTRATELTRRRIQLDPLGELGYRTLMQLQAESGDRAAAMSTYHRCATVLERELGVSPDRETTRGLERLLGRTSGSGPERHLAGGWARRSRAVGVGLIGRDREVDLLLRYWEKAAGGRSKMVVVSGEAGIGKSRVVAELADLAGAEGAVVASTRCFGMSTPLPLAPVAEWLRNGALRSAVRTLEPVWQNEVGRLVPSDSTELRSVSHSGDSAGSSLPPRGHSEGARAMADAWQRHRFFEGLARAVLATDLPTLLVLDDIQWCDQQTLAWLSFILSFAQDARLMVAATVRSDELGDDRAIGSWLRAWRSAGLLSEISLSPLDSNGTEELASSVRGRPLAALEKSFLHAATGGFPLFVIEAARSLPETGASSEALPTGDLDAFLRHRLGQTSVAAREVAGLAAAVGRDFSLDLLTEASDLDAETVVRAVDELWRRRILREQHGGYDFSHDLLRDAAYASVSPPGRWLLHRRLAQGLELLHAGHLDEVAAQLAEQYDRGGRPDRALHYFARSADVAAGVFANAEALRHHRRCLQLLGQRPAGRDRDSQELEILRAMSAPLNALHGYSSPELERTLERSLALAERLGRPRVQVACLVGLFSVRFVQGHAAESHEIGARALALAEAGSDPDLTGQAHFAFAGSATSLGLPATAIEHFELASELSLDSVSLILGTRLEVHARAWAAHAHWLLGDESRASSLSSDAVRRGRAVDHPYSLAVGLAYAAITHQLRGDRAALLTASAELRELCQRYEFAYYREWAVILEGWATGGDEGVAKIRKGIARLRSRGSLARMPYWLSLLAEALVGCGQEETARTVLDGAHVAAAQRDDRWWLPEVLRLRAQLEPGVAGADLLRLGLRAASRQGSRTLEARCRADLMTRGLPAESL